MVAHNNSTAAGQANTRFGFDALPVAASVRPDRDQIKQWWTVILKTVPPKKGQEVSIRLFWSNKPDRTNFAPDRIKAMPYETPEDFGKIVDCTMLWAEWALRQKDQKGEIWVVCPVAQVFYNGDSEHRDNKTPGGRVNLAAVGTIFAELDERPQSALATAQARLGQPSMVLASGGIWTAPDGTSEDKLHAYWNIDPPARTKDEIDRLWVVSAKLKERVEGGDDSVQPVHPMRAAGTVHTKTDTHRLARILSTIDRTVTLEEAEAALADVTPGARKMKDQAQGNGTASGKGTTVGPKLDVAKVMDDLLGGGDFHANVVSLSASLLQRGLGTADVEDILKVLVQRSPRAASDKARVRDLLNGEIKKAVLSAEFKFVQDGFNARAEGRKLWSPFRNEDMARIPLNALNPKMRKWAEDRAEMIGLDVNGLLGAMIGAASIAANGEIALELGPGYEVPPWLWIMVVGDVSDKKTPAIKAAGARVLNSMAIDAVKAHDRAVRDWETDIEDNYKGKVPKSQWPPYPIPGRQYATTDATPEALAGILSNQNCGIGIIIDEICNHLEGFGSYNAASAKKAVTEVLELWNGDQRIVNRASGGRGGGARKIVVERWAAGILGGIQTDILEELDGRIVRNGLLARYIPVIMAPASGGTMAGSMDLDFWDNTLRAISRVPAITVRLDLDALMAYANFVPQVDELKRLPFSSPVRGALGKVQGLVGRVALVLHLIDLGVASVEGGDAPDITVVSGDTMDRAISLVRDWIVPAVITFWDVMARGKDGSLLQEIGRYILRHQQTHYTVRDFKQNVRGLKNADTWKIERALGQFEAGDWLLREGETRKGSARWAANSLIWEHFEAEAERVKEQAVSAKEKWREWTAQD